MMFIVMLFLSSNNDEGVTYMNGDDKYPIVTPALNYLLHVMTFEESFNKVATKRILILLRSFSKSKHFYSSLMMN